MPIPTPDINPPNTVETRPQRPLPTPEDVGFKQIVGQDILPGVFGHRVKPASALEKLARSQIDNTQERRGRWEQYLAILGQVGNDPIKGRAAIDMLHTQAEALQENDPRKDVLDWTRSIIGNFGDPVALNAVLERGTRESMQEAMAQANRVLLLPQSRELRNVVHAAIALAGERYAQVHGGQGYRTLAERQQLQDMKARAATVEVR